AEIIFVPVCYFDAGTVYFYTERLYALAYKRSIKGPRSWIRSCRFLACIMGCSGYQPCQHDIVLRIHTGVDSLPENGPDDFSLSLLEFNKLLGIIADFAHSEASRNAVLSMHPLADRSSIEKRLCQISEIMRIYEGGGTLSILQFSDIEPLLIRVAPEGAVLEALEIAEFMPVLDNISAIASQISLHEDLSQMNELAGTMKGFPEILRVLERSLDSEGNILDSASPELAGLRGQIRRLEGKIRKKLEDVVRDGDVSVFLQDDFITNRSGRWVIPVRMDSKGQVQGVVHDVSKSGETAFIEPLSIISLSNELENLV